MDIKLSVIQQVFQNVCVCMMIKGPVDSQDESLLALPEVPLAVTLLLFCRCGIVAFG